MLTGAPVNDAILVDHLNDYPDGEVLFACRRIARDGPRGDGDYAHYVATPHHSEAGPAFTVERLNVPGDTQREVPYIVVLTPRPSCTCPGFAHRGKCRHTLALAALWARGELRLASYGERLLHTLAKSAG